MRPRPIAFFFAEKIPLEWLAGFAISVLFGSFYPLSIKGDHPMGSLYKSLISKVLCGFLLLPSCIYLPATLRAQEKEAQYTAEEYKAYQDIAAENESSKKIGLIVKFMQDYPKSSLQQHVMAAYQGMMGGLQSSQLVSCGEQFLKVMPGDAYTFSMLATGYQRTNNLKQFVVFGERAFEKKPDGNLAYYMAKAYKDMQDDAKYIQWGEKALNLLPDNHELLLDMAKSFAKYAKQGIKVLTTIGKPDGVEEKAWKEYTSNGLANFYAIVGNVAYEAKDYATAVSNLENSVKYFKRNGLAYYYLGLSYWQQNKVDMAMLDLAKAYLLGGGSAAAAKQHLDNLYKSTHQQTLIGQERVINKAKEELK
jgi:tetratricopeptide (TPR) repeat protein